METESAVNSDPSRPPVLNLFQHINTLGNSSVPSQSTTSHLPDSELVGPLVDKSVNPRPLNVDLSGITGSSHPPYDENPGGENSCDTLKITGSSRPSCDENPGGKIF